MSTGSHAVVSWSLAPHTHQEKHMQARGRGRGCGHGLCGALCQPTSL